MSTMTLLPCPFCGGEPEIVRAQDEDGRFAAVGCPHCGAGSRQHYFVGDDAVPHVASAWNRRAHLAQPAQAVGVGAIRDVIEQMRKASAQRAMPPHYEAGCYMAWIDDLTRAISGEKAGPAYGWQPIETAPDGELLIYWPATTGRNAQREMMRVDRKGMTPHRLPSHWMPLPAPPAAEIAKGVAK